MNKNILKENKKNIIKLQMSYNWTRFNDGSNNGDNLSNTDIINYFPFLSQFYICFFLCHRNIKLIF